MKTMEKETEHVIAQEAFQRLVDLHGSGNVWDTDGLRANFSVESFLAPYCVVKRKSDGMVGTLKFDHQPRYYYNFIADESW